MSFVTSNLRALRTAVARCPRQFVSLDFGAKHPREIFARCAEGQTLGFDPHCSFAELDRLFGPDAYRIFARRYDNPYDGEYLRGKSGKDKLSDQDLCLARIERQLFNLE